MENIVVGIADAKIGRKGQILVSYALGSCVGICLYDTGSRTAGLLHVILPEKNMAARPDNLYKFADTGIPALIKALEKKGIPKNRLKAKIAGGAKMFSTGSVDWEIGLKNVEAVKRVLKQEGISITAEDTGKDYGRTLLFYVDSGRLEIKSVKHGTVVI